jgi:hypothetical protein
MTPKPARALAWMTFAVGIVVSVLGNIGHAASDGMQSGEWAGAAFWPVALLLSVEILVRVHWQPEKRWTIARFTGLVVVSIVSAILSYLHLRSLLIVWDYGSFQGTIGPLAVDGLMLIAASALLSISKERPVVVVPPDITPAPDPVDAEIEQLLTVTDRPKIETSRNVPPDAAENAAFQAWMNAPAGQKPSGRKLAALTGLSPSKAHRLITRWRELEPSR